MTSKTQSSKKKCFHWQVEQRGRTDFWPRSRSPARPVSRLQGDGQPGIFLTVYFYKGWSARYSCSYRMITLFLPRWLLVGVPLKRSRSRCSLQTSAEEHQRNRDIRTKIEMTCEKFQDQVTWRSRWSMCAITVKLMVTSSRVLSQNFWSEWA